MRACEIPVDHWNRAIDVILVRKLRRHRHRPVQINARRVRFIVPSGAGDVATIVRAPSSHAGGLLRQHMVRRERKLASVTRGDVGTLSDKMHGLGNYKGLTYLSNDPAKNEFTYRADFDKGAMDVVVRVDSDGKLAAYRVFPQRQT